MKTTTYKVYLPMDNKYYLDAIEQLKGYPDFVRLLDQLHDELQRAVHVATPEQVSAFATASDFLIRLAERTTAANVSFAHHQQQSDVLHTRTTELLNSITKQVS